uniref:Late nodulin-like protein n=1 Tax=Astragalus sinicus TaxID=47065 RepID=Q07A35_ASTSI|nr:late nodulin-like protein [Astragalus sinicus]
MVVIKKLFYVTVLLVSLFLMAINVNAIIPCVQDSDCKKLWTPEPGWELKCIDEFCRTVEI